MWIRPDVLLLLSRVSKKGERRRRSVYTASSDPCLKQSVVIDLLALGMQLASVRSASL